jgi:hypothetical protein
MLVNVETIGTYLSLSLSLSLSLYIYMCVCVCVYTRPIHIGWVGNYEWIWIHQRTCVRVFVCVYLEVDHKYTRHSLIPIRFG